jgi:RHS repeat-associated protein
MGDRFKDTLRHDDFFNKTFMSAGTDVQMFLPTARWWLSQVADHLGTPWFMTNSLKSFWWQGEYYPFGDLYWGSAYEPNAHRLPGQYEDNESGLYYNWHRYYDPVTGRYRSADPLGLRGDLALFNYTGNNPLPNTDPKGLAWYSDGGQLYWYPDDYADRIPYQYYTDKLVYYRMQDDGTTVPETLQPNARVFIVDDEFNSWRERARSYGRAIRYMPFEIRYGAMVLGYANNMPFDLKAHRCDVFTNERNKYLIYGDRVYRPDDMGNILYGYGGRYAGFSEIDLRLYAGIFQTLNNVRHWRPPINAPYLDERKDQYHIGIGFWLYDND